MYIRQNICKFFLIFSLILVFMISSCSKPSEDKEMSSKQAPEASEKAQAPKPESPKVVTPKPAPESVIPEPVTPEPVKESSLADIITMESPAYTKHKKGIVLFTHKKHVEEYKIDCGQCHHDKEGMPLNDLTINDKVDACIKCHAKLGQAPRPKNKKKLSQKEKREYHAEAIHENCIQCHKKYNKENDTKAAPASCSKCHPKKG